MRIIATFANFKDDPSAVEMVHAWDEFQIDENYDGYVASLEEALSSYGNELAHICEVYIEIPMDEIRERLAGHVTVKGTVAVQPALEPAQT